MTRGYPGVLAKHGTRARYKKGCGCAPCTAANTRDHKVRLLDSTPRTVPAVGTRRRLEALAALGWANATLAARLGWTKAMVHHVRGRDVVLRSTAQRVAALYDELSMTPPVPSTPGERSGYARGRLYAARAGWAPPLAWTDIDDPDEVPDLGAAPDPDVVDPVLIDRLLSGRPSAVPTAERPAIVRELAGRGLPDPQIAQLLCVTPRTVLRDRQDHDIESRWAS